ncbi:MAG: DUF3179 domain-containing protein [Wenzhouxiangellaceae bacterium]|nr:DUF3179 domain-containing protein [Wenzhouxiangellaceae bacterium]
MMMIPQRFSRPAACAATIFLAAMACSSSAQEDRPRNRFDHDILVETFGFDETTPASVEFEHLYQGCPARDCIPSIDEPRYVDAEKAAEFMAEDELIMAMDYRGHQRAWPVRILDFHEIVNDSFDGEPVAITWCPLCGSGVAFERRVNGKTVELGVSGVLHDSDLVMYDRATESLWQQITGEAIMGPALGSVLTQVPVTMTTWGKWRDAHPDTVVLSIETGFDMDYGTDRRYAEYEASDQLAFPAARRDLSVHPKSVVFGFNIGEVDLAVMESSLDEADGSLEREVNGENLTIKRRPDGTVIATDDAGNTYHSNRVFWFAWFNFHPGTIRI